MTLTSNLSKPTEGELTRVAHELVDDVLSSTPLSDYEIDKREYLSFSASKVSKAIPSGEKENSVPHYQQRPINAEVNTGYFSITRGSPSEQNLSEKPVPVLASHKRLPSNGVSIPIIRIDPLQDRNITAPSRPPVATTHSLEKPYTRSRDPGVGAASPTSPPVPLGFDTWNAAYNAPMRSDKTNFPTSSQHQVQKFYSQDAYRNNTAAKRSYYCGAVCETSIDKWKPLERNQILKKLEKNLRPFTTPLPTYTPSSAYLLSLTQPEPEHSLLRPTISSPTAFFSHYESFEDRQSSPYRLIGEDFVPTVTTSITPDSFRPLPKHRSKKRSVKQQIRHPSKVKDGVPKCTNCALTWWQPLNRQSPDSPLPEPRRDVVSRMACQQAIRDAVLARAITQAEQVAKQEKHKKFEAIRERARNTRKEDSLRYTDDANQTKKPRRNRSMPNNRNFTRSVLYLPGPPEREVPDGMDEKPKSGVAKKQHSSDELLPYSRDSWWPTRPAEDFYDNLPARRFMNDTAASRSRSVSRPKRRTRSPSNWKTENSRYGEYTLMDKSRPRDTKVKTRTKFAEETAKQMSTSEKPELLRKAQSTSNVSVTPSKPLIKKYHPPGLVKKLRRRCDSIDRELDRLADSRPQLDGSSPVDSDPTMESLTVANQALHDRLTELRTLQRKRDKNLKKARALVDDLITEQKVHSDQIRSNAPPDSQTSSGSSSPLQFSQEVSIRTSNKPFPITRRKPGEVLFRSCDLGEFKWDRKGSPLKLYSTAGEGSDGRNVDRIEKLNEQANCTKNVLERLREDFADLSRNVTRVEAKARDAAQAVNMLVNQARYLEDDQCFGPCDACKHTMRCRCLSQADTKPRVTTSIPKARIPSSSPNTISYVPPRLDNRNNTYSVKRNSPYRSVGWEFRE